MCTELICSCRHNKDKSAAILDKMSDLLFFLAHSSLEHNGMVLFGPETMPEIGITLLSHNLCFWAWAWEVSGSWTNTFDHFRYYLCWGRCWRILRQSTTRIAHSVVPSWCISSILQSSWTLGFQEKRTFSTRRALRFHHSRCHSSEILLFALLVYPVLSLREDWGPCDAAFVGSLSSGWVNLQYSRRVSCGKWPACEASHQGRTDYCGRILPRFVDGLLL